jgi:hypothetical protein
VVQARGEDAVDLVQQRTGSTFLIALHCPAIGFAQRVGAPTTTEQGLALLQAEFAGLMNLAWVHSVRCSADGTMLALEMRQH